jgi:high affinity Mn2+ porin
VEVPIEPNWTAKLEYLIADFGRGSVTFPAAAQRFDSDLVTQSIRLGMNYRLGGDLARSDVFTKGLSALELENFSLHAQTTFTSQYAVPFHAPFRGPNSLDSNAGRQTWDVTAFLGMRLWSGAELWINPEIDQGFGLSGTFGVAGFPSGEAYKVGASYPYARVPRTFLRQTIDLGGETQKVDASANQFSGSQTADRLVITAGKFGVTDVFDTNKYAHDPRGDFMNWTIVDTGTWDYAADAWAYTYGAAVEWYRGQWTLRGGVFDLSVAPNTTNLDPRFGQFQWDGEIDTVGGQQLHLLGRPFLIGRRCVRNRSRSRELADELGREIGFLLGAIEQFVIDAFERLHQLLLDLQQRLDLLFRHVEKFRRK